MGPKNAVLTARGFTRQAVGISRTPQDCWRQVGRESDSGGGPVAALLAMM